MLSAEPRKEKDIQLRNEIRAGGGDLFEIDDSFHADYVPTYGADDANLQKLAQTAMNFEHAHHTFSTDDLTSLLTHFKLVEKSTNDGTLTRKEFAQCFKMLGVHGFLVEVLFEAFTWDEGLSQTHVNIKDFLCGFILLTIGKAEEKLGIAFQLHDPDNSGCCGIEQLHDIFRCAHMVLARMTKQFPRNCQKFTNEMMLHIHNVATEGGKPVRRVTLAQFIQACSLHAALYACLTTMEEKQGPRKSVTELYQESRAPVLKTRSKHYDQAGRKGLSRYFPCLVSDTETEVETDAWMAERLDLGVKSSQAEMQSKSSDANGQSGEGSFAKSLRPGVNREVLLDWLLGRESWHVMLSFLLGVRRSVERLAMQDIQLIPESFKKVRVIQVPSHSPSSTAAELEVRDYAPAVFQHVRKMYNISDEEYVKSLSPLPILGNLLLGNLRSLSKLVSEGKSGSLLYFSEDKRYVIKTITNSEKKTFLHILQSYYDYIRSNPHTLIIRFFGMYEIMLPAGRTLTFTVMANVLDTPLAIHRRYDIKGSSVGRSALKGKPPSHRLATVCFKDNDLTFRFQLPMQARRDLVVQIGLDANWLSTHGLIDYSLMVGVHSFPENEHPVSSSATATTSRAAPPTDEDAQNNLDPSNDNDDPDSRTRDVSQLYAPARPHAPGLDDEGWRWRSRFQNFKGGMKCTASEGADLGPNCMIAVGIIDCFTHFNTRKRFERAFKIIGGASPRGISVMPPAPYARRFVTFVCDSVLGESHLAHSLSLTHPTTNNTTPPPTQHTPNTSTTIVASTALDESSDTAAASSSAPTVTLSTTAAAITAQGRSRVGVDEPLQDVAF